MIVESTLHTRLSGRQIILAKAAWVGVAVLVLTLLLAGLPAAFNAQLRAAESFRPSLAQLGLSVNFYALYFLSVDIASFMIFAAMGLAIFWRKSDDGMVIFVSFVCITYGTLFAAVLLPLTETQPAWRWPVFFVRSLGLGTSLIFIYIFPDGRFVPGWTRWLAIVWAIAVLTWFIFPAAPFNLIYLDTWLRDFKLSFPLYLGIYASGLYAQIYRYLRASNAAQRQQTKWILFGLTAAILGFGIYNLLLAIFPSLGQPGVPRLLYLLIGLPAHNFCILLVPLCMAISILRHRLWDIDFVINRSLVYAALTALLGVVFGCSLFIISQLFQNFPGGQLAAVAVSALIDALIFQPVRERLQRFVDRRFYNIQIDYQKDSRPSASRIASPPLRPHFGSYTSLELIGRGGMAEVYKARDSAHQREVALKILPAALAGAPDFRQRFKREAQTVAALQHPNIVRVFDFGEVDGLPYLAMEYLAGEDLGQYLLKAGRLPLNQALPFIQAIAGALDYAHAQGLVHRDIKPSNVMLDSVEKGKGRPASLSLASVRPVLTDFGLAKISGGVTRLTQTGVLVGTFDYIAPEQIQASADVDGRADVYAFGVVVYQMLTGELPFKHSHPGALLIAHLTQPAPDPRDLLPDLSSEAANAISRALAKNPDDRYRTAGEFAAALALCVT